MNERGTGSDQYPPSLLLGLLIYSYASGVFSSRQIERSTHDSVAVRVLCADTHPDHDTLCTFRRENAALLAAAFAQVLELAAHCGVLHVAGITVAIDGTKVLANASKHAAVSYARAGETMRQLDLEVAELLAKAVGDALKAGVNGYVLKHHAFEQMMEAIKAALHGKIWLSPQLSKVAVRGQVPSLIDLLTPREREVFQLLAEGHQTKEVAFRLEVSPKTIETHRLSLLSKLKADGVADLIRMAIREGLVKL